MPLLVAIFDVVGIIGAQLIGVGRWVESGSFWSQMQSAVEMRDINEGLVKSLVFGVACSLMAVYEGFHAEPTAEGVGLATTRTVVIAVLTLLFDYLLTAAFREFLRSLGAMSNTSRVIRKYRHGTVRAAGVCRAGVPVHAAASQRPAAAQRNGQLSGDGAFRQRR